MTRRFASCVGAIACWMIVISSQGQTRYESRTNHSPDGIGKFYMGREISHVMGHQAADWLERPERDTEEHTSDMLKALEVKPGCIVADIGAGTGYFTRRLAQKAAKVYAVDIQPEMLVMLSNSMAQLQITNVVPVLGSITNPSLPSNSVDLALMVDVYHEFSHPFEMMRELCKALKPKGQVVFVEFRAEDPTVPIKPLHKMSEAQVRREMEVHPLRWLKTIPVLPRQHIIVFERR